MKTGNVLICTVKITQVYLLLLLVPSSSSQTDESILAMQPGKRESSLVATTAIMWLVVGYIQTARGYLNRKNMEEQV